MDYFKDILQRIEEYAEKVSAIKAGEIEEVIEWNHLEQNWQKHKSDYEKYIRKYVESMKIYSSDDFYNRRTEEFLSKEEMEIK